MSPRKPRLRPTLDGAWLSVVGVDARRSADSHRAEPTPRTQPLTAKKRSETRTEPRANRNATDYALEVELRRCDPSQFGSHRAPGPPRVVGAGRDRRSRRRSGRERSVPAPISRGRSGHRPAVEGTGSRRTQQRGDRRDLVPGAGTTHFSGAVAFRDTIPAVANRSPHWLRFLGASLDRLAREPCFRSFAVSALLQR